MHITQTLIEAAARGELPRELLSEIDREHRAAICPVCAEAIAAYEAGLAPAAGRSPAKPLDPIERLRRRLGLGELRLRWELSEARAWVREIVRLDPGKRCGKIRGAYSRLQGPVFGTLLLEAARRAIPEQPAESLSLAEAALVSCRRTRFHDPDPEISTAALAVRGNAKRALGRLRQAEADLEQARRLLDSPTVTEPTTAAELYSYLGSLRKDQGRLDEAARWLHRAAVLFRLEGDGERAARVFLTLGLVHYHRHQGDDAVGAAEKALELMGSSSDLCLLAYARYDLAFFLHARGDTDRAEEELAAHEDLLEAGGDWVALHVVWLRARIAWSRGELAPAQRLFEEARKLALARGIAFDVSLVSLELALVHLARGHTRRVKALAAEAVRVFAEQEVARETLAALELVEAAARREALTREMVERAVVALERARQGASASGPEPS